MRHAYQPAFDECGQPLVATTFVVVDLETTGSTPESSITEIGAVKIRGGQILAEFSTLVNPATSIPPLIAVLTGITDSMVAGAPYLKQVLPTFLQFIDQTVLVAHNARFDVGFLRRACDQEGYDWPQPQVIDTVALARQVLPKGEVPNVKLATLARHFSTADQPNHRALSDARATVEVLHALLERVGNRNVHTLEDLQEYLRFVSPERRAKRTLAHNLPERPGVYSFISNKLGDEKNHILYVGKSRNLKKRVASYFTASETRPRMEEMIRIATEITHIECATELEAEIRELRLIAAHTPRYNRRSKFPQRMQWLKITTEAFPRLSIVRTVVDDGATYFGPFSQRGLADDVQLALYDAFPLRQCHKKLSLRQPSDSCALAEIDKCAAPCELSPAAETYRDIVEQVRSSLLYDIRPVIRAAQPRLAKLVAQQRYEEAAQVRTRLQNFLRASVRHHRIASLARLPHAVAARLVEQSWHIHVIRFGRLAAAAVAQPGEAPQEIAAQAVAVAETVLPTPAPTPAALIEETERIADWLELPGVRFIELEGDWQWPLHGAMTEDIFAQYILGHDQKIR